MNAWNNDPDLAMIRIERCLRDFFGALALLSRDVPWCNTGMLDHTGDVLAARNWHFEAEAA